MRPAKVRPGVGSDRAQAPRSDRTRLIEACRAVLNKSDTAATPSLVASTSSPASGQCRDAGNHHPPRSQRPRPTSRCAMRPFADLLFTTTDGGAPSSARSLFPHSTSPSLSEITFPRATDMLRIAFQWCILVMACKIRRQRIAGGVRWPRKQYISVRDSLSICYCCCVRM